MSKKFSDHILGDVGYNIVASIENATNTSVVEIVYIHLKKWVHSTHYHCEKCGKKNLKSGWGFFCFTKDPKGILKTDDGSYTLNVYVLCDECMKGEDGKRFELTKELERQILLINTPDPELLSLDFKGD